MGQSSPQVCSQSTRVSLRHPYKGPRSPGLQFAGSPASVCHAGICLELFPAPVGPSGRSPPQIEQWTESREGKEQGPHSTHFVPKGGASRCAGTWGFVPSARGARASPRKQSRFAARALAARHWLSGRDLPSCAGRSPAPRLGTESAPLPPFTGGGQAHRTAGGRGRGRGAVGGGWSESTAPPGAWAGCPSLVSVPRPPPPATPPPVDAPSQPAFPFPCLCNQGSQGQGARKIQREERKEGEGEKSQNRIGKKHFN